MTGPRFSDFVPGDPGYEEVIILVSRNLFHGTVVGAFEPERIITYAELSRLVLRSAGLFVHGDLPNGFPRYDPVLARYFASAVHDGIIHPSKSSGPDTGVSREVVLRAVRAAFALSPRYRRAFASLERLHAATPLTGPLSKLFGNCPAAGRSMKRREAAILVANLLERLESLRNGEMP